MGRHGDGHKRGTIDAAQLDEHGNAERHGGNHHQRVGRAHNAHLHVAVEHVVHEVDERHARHDEEGAGQQRMERRRRPRRGQERRGPRQQRRHEGRDGDAHIVVDAKLVAFGAQAEAQDGSHRGVEKGRPVAAKLDAEAAAGKAGADGHLPGRIVAAPRAYGFQFLLVAVDCVVLANGAPRQFADGRYGRHVHAVLFAALEL